MTTEAKSGYVTGARLDTALESKQDKLTYGKYVVIGVYGQSNAAGYDESPLTKYDIPVHPDRVLQYSDSLKPLTFCAENIQDMSKVEPRSGTAAAMATDRAGNDAFVADGRTQYVMTKGIHLPLANLVCSVIPADYGVIIVPAGDGGKALSSFVAGTDNYNTLLSRVKAAMDISPDNVFAGIVWCQGEFDAGSTAGSSYASTFSAMATAFCGELSAYVKQGARHDITINDWYCYEWPAYYKDRDTTGILPAMKSLLGDRYVSVPYDTPHNTTTYTTTVTEAHFAGNSFRTVIAPRVFDAMCNNGAFLCNTGTVESVQEEILELSSTVAALTSRLSALDDFFTTNMSAVLARVNELSALHDLDPIAVYRWRPVTPADWTAAFGSGGTLSGDTYVANNLKSGYVLSPDVKGIRFKIGSTKSVGQHLAWLLCYTVGGTASDVRGVTMDFNSSSQDTFKKWVKCNAGYNQYDGDNGLSGNAESYGLFNKHGVDITAEIQDDGRIKVTSGDNTSYLVNREGDAHTLGLGFLNGFSDTMRFYDIQVLAKI